MKIRFQVDPERLTLNDLIDLEDQNQSPRFMRDFLAKFAVDDQGEYLPYDIAQEMVGCLTLTELLGAVEEFTKGVDAIVPKVNASP